MRFLLILYFHFVGLMDVYNLLARTLTKYACNITFVNYVNILYILYLPTDTMLWKSYEIRK